MERTRILHNFTSLSIFVYYFIYGPNITSEVVSPLQTLHNNQGHSNKPLVALITVENFCVFMSQKNFFQKKHLWFLCPKIMIENIQRNHIFVGPECCFVSDTIEWRWYFHWASEILFKIGQSRTFFVRSCPLKKGLVTWRKNAKHITPKTNKNGVFW